MMKRLKLAMVACGVLVTSVGCSTIHFKNGQGSATPYENSEWHHTVIFTLMEESDPVDLHNRCNGKAWDTVTTKRTFINGLAGSIDSILIGVDLWEPWTGESTCR
jgi:hypothetical protein